MVIKFPFKIFYYALIVEKLSVGAGLHSLKRNEQHTAPIAMIDADTVVM